MLNQKNGTLLVSMAVILAGCGPPEVVDVTQYLGKTQPEIVKILGEPSSSWSYLEEVESLRGREWVRQHYAALKKSGEICYDLDQKPLPAPLRELKCLFSNSGYCHQVVGITKDYDSPERVLKAIGLGNLEVRSQSPDRLGFSYNIPPFERVQVHKPSSVQRYSNFSIFNGKSGNPKLE